MTLRTTDGQSRGALPIVEPIGAAATRIRALSDVTRAFVDRQLDGDALWRALLAVVPLRVGVLLLNDGEHESVLTWRERGVSHVELDARIGEARRALGRPTPSRARRRPRGSRAPGGDGDGRRDGDGHGAHEDEGRTLVRLGSGSEDLGVLLLACGGALVDEDRAFLEALGGVLGLAAHARRAEREVTAARETTRRLEALQRVSRATLAGSSLAEMLPGMLRTLCDLFATDAAAVFLRSGDAPTLQPICSIGLPGRLDDLPLGAGAVGLIAVNGPTIVDDLGELPEHGRVASELRSLIGAPLEVDDRRIGVLYTASHGVRGFTRDELTTISIVSGRVAGAIERARLLDAQRRLTRQLVRVGRAVVQIADLEHGPALDLEDRLMVVAREARRIVAADHAVLGIADGRRDGFELWTEDIAPTMARAHHGGAPALATLLAHVSAIARPLRLADGGGAAILRELGLGDLRLGALLVVPIVRQGRSTGALLALRRIGARAFGDGDQRALELLAAHAGVVVENARLFADVAAERRRFAGLAAASEALGRSLDPETVLATLARALVDCVADWCICRGLEPDAPTGTACAPGFEGVLADAGRGAPLDPSQVSQLELRLELGERRFGAALLGRSIAGDRPLRFADDDRALAAEICRRAAVALDNAWHHARTLEAVHGRDVMLSVVSHDLRNPLSNIHMRAALLLEQQPASRLHVEPILAAADRMDRLIEDLLTVGRLEAGTLVIEARRESARALVRDALDAVALAAAHKAVDLHDAGPDLALWCDRQRVLQVLVNLLTNAIKFTAPGGRVEARVGRAVDDAALAVLEVADTGYGIPADELPRVFERYWQGNAGARQGVGIGLSIARGIVEAHGGAIEARSQPGRGTTIAFTLPLAPSSTGASTP